MNDQKHNRRDSPEELRRLAQRTRTLAGWLTDSDRSRLEAYADELEKQARQAERRRKTGGLERADGVMKGPPATATYTTAALARAGGVDVRTVRLYEQMGLLPPLRRRRGRPDDVAYHAEHVARLRFIARALALGFDLTDMAKLAGADGLRTCRDTHEVGVRAAEVRRRTGGSPSPKLETLLAACSRHGPAAECPILQYLEERPDRRP